MSILSGLEEQLNKARRGRVEYTGRAFHQDATEAMKGDVIRALIETLTNSDDAYGDEKGKIRVEVEHKKQGPWRVVTRDRAQGMRATRLEEAIARLGGRTSGFERGRSVRGNLGRGAKDLAAFGIVTFESICDDFHAKLVLDPSGDYVLDAERKATKEVREALGISRGNGTVVTITAAENIRCPRHNRLAEKLQKHYQLRDILSDPRRDVMLTDSKGDEITLRYSYPSLSVALSGEVDIEGYPGVTANITIYRNDERYDDPPSDSGRPGGMLVKGRRAIYENTYFKFEANPYSGWFSGRVECPYIDQLAAEYDHRLVVGEGQDEKNPMPIITRRRDGLQHAHPFYKALAAAVEGALGKLIVEEERKARETSATENIGMRRALDSLGRDLARLIDEDLREMDEDGLTGGPGGKEVQPSRTSSPSRSFCIWVKTRRSASKLGQISI